jgi:hypothetical protein
MFMARRGRPDGEPRARRLPQRWALIVAASLITGVAVAMKAGLGAAIVAGVTVAVGLHTMME